MSRSSSWRVVFAFVVVVVLTAPAVQAAGLWPGPGTTEGQRAALTSWRLFSQLWDRLARLWFENGCQVDPWGRCQPDSDLSSVSGDNGCQVDPDGRCIG